MSRSTTALKRLGVPGLAAVTLVAGLPLFLGSASAAHITGLDLSPATSSDAANVCVPYTAQITFASAAQAVAETLDVDLNEATGSATQDADFCTLPTGTVTPATPSDVTDGGAAGTSDHAEFRTDAAGKVTFGVTANQPGDVAIRVYYETTDNDTFNAGEFQDNSVQTFTAGGPTGSNANQDAAGFVEVVAIGEPNPATATVTTSTDTDEVVETETRTYRVFVGQDSDSRLNGVTVNYAINSTIDSADRGTAIFGVTDNNGIATGTITYPARTEASGSSTTNTTSTDVVTFFVNRTGALSTPGFDSALGEPSDTLTATVRDSGAQQGRSLNITPVTEGTAGTFYATGTDSAVNPATDGNRQFRVVVDAPTGQTATAGTLLGFTVTGGSGDETVTPAEPATADDPSADTNDSFVVVTVNDPTPTVGQTLTLTGTIRGANPAVTDTATLTFRNTPADARFINLTPPTGNAAPNTAFQLTATVTDVDGKPVQGVFVAFTETGAGAFRNGSSNAGGTTNAAGVVTVEVISLPGETGTETVTADISQATTGDVSQCGQAANTGTDPQGNALNGTTNTGAAGVCTDSSTVTFTTATQSPTATPTASTTPPASQGPCPTTPPTVQLERSTIIATGRVNYRVTNAPANSQVQIFAYSRPSTTYRVVRNVTIGGDGNGPGGDGFTPPTNTRLYAQVVGCDTDESRFSVVINVRTQISLNVVRNGTRDYTFSGRLLPARPGGLIASLYRVTNDGRQILTAQTRANASDGRYTINRVFTGSGRFGFVVRTGQDLQNAPGASNVRSLLVF